MLDPLIVQKLKDRYPYIHPLIFHRSCERAKSNGDLFDILDTIPDKFPIIWCDTANRWVSTQDLYLSEGFFGEIK